VFVDLDRSCGKGPHSVRARTAEDAIPSGRGRWYTVTLTPVAVLCLVLSIATTAQAQRPMITGWLAANAECKGGHGDDAKKACQRRDQLGATLTRRGCEYQEDGDWWKCPHH
jgi:hypothetical protein